MDRVCGVWYVCVAGRGLGGGVVGSAGAGVRWATLVGGRLGRGRWLGGWGRGGGAGCGDGAVFVRWVGEWGSGWVWGRGERVGECVW